jgi:hypothetical protein
MKSIRLSLVLYFLALLAAALGAVSVFAYRYTEHVLDSKEESRRALLDDRYHRACENESRSLEWRLNALWRRVTGSVHSQLHPPVRRTQTNAPIDFQFNEEAILPHHEKEPNIPEYFQINIEGGHDSRSRSMGEHSFPFDAAAFARMEPFKLKYDETELKPGVHVLRASWKGDTSRVLLFPRQRGGMPGTSRDGGKRPPPPAADPPERGSAQGVLIQCEV